MEFVESRRGRQVCRAEQDALRAAEKLPARQAARDLAAAQRGFLAPAVAPDLSAAALIRPAQLVATEQEAVCPGAFVQEVWQCVALVEREAAALETTGELRQMSRRWRLLFRCSPAPPRRGRGRRCCR
jgi:hypothetical protein